VALKAQAIASPTDFEQRKHYIAYYTLLADRIGKIDPTIKKEEIDALRSTYAGQYLQNKITLTVDPATFRNKHN
jgi:hypothetical protein